MPTTTISSPSGKREPLSAQVSDRPAVAERFNSGREFGFSAGQTVAVTDRTAVSDIVGAADAAGQAIIPHGGGTGQAYGYLPTRADIRLDLNGLNRILAVEPGDLTITVEAGATLAAVQEALAPHNQFLPLDPPHAATATIGGILATDASGPSRAVHGGARDWLIGLTVVDAAGSLVHGGGRVVKNVTGYDIPKLHVGALGTLGVIVEATFKVAPRPDTSRALLFELPEDPAKGESFLHLVFCATTPTLRLVRDMAGRRVAAFIYSGMEEVVKAERAIAAQIGAEARIPGISRVPDGVDRPFAEPDMSPNVLMARIIGLPSQEIERHCALFERYGTVLRRLDTFPGSGQTEMFFYPDCDALALAGDLVAWSDAAGARITFPQAPPELRDPGLGIPLWSPLPPAFPLMRRLKEVLDPNSTLNPGRFLGRL